MPNNKQCGGSSAFQKGRAGEMRTATGTNKQTRNDLHLINHSGDKNLHKKGHNTFGDQTNSYDKEAQKVISSAERQLKPAGKIQKSLLE
jgi:flagellar basal body rod protein FlgG